MINTNNINIQMDTSNSEIAVSLANVVETTLVMNAIVHDVRTTNHDELENRNIPDQHTIEAITGLREELNEIKNNTITSYNDLSDKPQINDIELIGNKTHNDIKISALDEVDIGAILD